jgi:hypothetical protein
VIHFQDGVRTGLITVANGGIGDLSVGLKTSTDINDNIIFYAYGYFSLVVRENR